MTGPGAAGASRMRIAGVALLAIAAVAAVVGLISLGGQGSSSTAAAPPPRSAVGILPGAATAPGAQPTLPPGASDTPGAPGAPVGTPAPPVTGSIPPAAGAPIIPPPDAAPGAAPGAGGGTGGGAAGGPGGGGPGGGGTYAAVSFRVLNNSMIVGLADRAAAEMRARGWNITGVGNYPGGIIPTSTIYYRPGTGEQPAAQAAASEFGVRVEPRFPGIADASPGIIVIATNDWGANAAGTKGG